MAVKNKIKKEKNSSVKLQVEKEKNLKLKKKLLEINNLYNAAQYIKTSLNTQKTLHLIIHIIHKLLKASTISIMLIDLKTNELVVKAAKNKQNIVGFRQKINEGIAGQVFLNGQPIIVKDIHRHRYAKFSKRNYQGKSFLSVPLKYNNKIIGLINLADKEKNASFDQQDKKIILEMANHIAIAVSHAEIHTNIQKQTFEDYLTGLHNRKFFFFKLAAILEKNKKKDTPFSVLLLDLDFFKNINDAYGHQIGDEILKKTAQTFQEKMRKTDLAARYSGEELIALLPNSNTKDAFRISEKIRKAIESLCLFVVEIKTSSGETKLILIEKNKQKDYKCLFFPLTLTSNHLVSEIEKIWIETLWLNKIKKKLESPTKNPDLKINEIKVTVSIGSASYPENTPHFSSHQGKHLITMADKALYKAKESGRNMSLTYRDILDSSNFIKKETKKQIISKLMHKILIKDKITFHHCLRVAKITEIIAQGLALAPKKIQQYTYGALLHDLGKIFIDEKILFKKDKLTELEYSIIKTHAIKGAEFITNFPALHPYINALKHHHEKWEGFGYPDGITGSKIPLEGRIIAIADSYDAMSTYRPYKKKISNREDYALCELRKNRDLMYDSKIIACFFKNYEKIKKVKDQKLSIVNFI
jgi:diguanylate cyclase (GGDEF)-like protein/putative nucleotidyltransferase with HDIG domain